MVVAAVTAAALLAALVGPAPAAAQPPAPAGFSDVSPGSHKPAIDALDQMGVFEGTLCGENRFCPSSHIDRSTMAVWLIRVLESGDPPDTDASGFADVDSDQWWAPFVERIADLEITVGCKREPLRYCPDELVTRARMATFLERAFDLDPADPVGFVDIAGSTHEANINALAASKLTVGCKKDPLSFCPNTAVSRAQMATFLHRAFNLLTFKATSAGGAHSCAIRTDEMTGPPRGLAERTVDGLQLADVRFSDNGATARTVGADAAAWRLRSPRNRNSIAVMVHDQYGNLYRGGDHEVQATDAATTDDFPGAVPEPDTGEEDLRGGYLVSRSGRRSIGYTHNGTRPLEQIVTLQLRVPGTASVDDDPDTTDVDEEVAYVEPVDVETGEKMVTIYWANRGGVPTDTSGDPILLADPAANFIIVDDQDFDDVDENNAGAIEDTYPVAYSYGDDDKFVVEGEVVTMDQFEEILAQHGDLPLLIADLGTLSWVGYDFNRPRDGATWSIDGISCREAPEGD